jgi:hypothetical protein
MYANEHRIQLSVSTSTSGDNALIAAPTAGYIAIDYIRLVPDGGANTLTFKNGAATLFGVVLPDDALFELANTIHDPQGILTMAPVTAFNLNLSAASSVKGFIRYRVVGA